MQVRVRHSETKQKTRSTIVWRFGFVKNEGQSKFPITGKSLRPRVAFT
jgi:hypothetical protein